MKLTSIITMVFAALWTPAFFASASAADAVFNGEVVSTIGDASGLSLQPGKVSGQGTFVYRSSLDTIGSDSSHGLSFTLNDGGQLKFVAYSDSSLGQGLEFVFSRSGDVVNGWVVVGGDPASALDISSELANVSASRVINLQIDVHNGESPAHILVWDGLEANFSEDNALVNTEEIANGSPGNGSGNSRGFSLNGATLLRAVATDVKFDH